MGIARKSLETIVKGTANTAGATLDIIEGTTGTAAMATPAAITHAGTTYAAQRGAGLFTNFLYPIGNALGLTSDKTLLTAKAGKLSSQALELASEATGYSVGTLTNAAYAGFGFLGVPYAINKVGDALEKITPGQKTKKIVRGIYDTTALLGTGAATYAAYAGLGVPYAPIIKPVLAAATTRLGLNAAYKGTMKLLKERKTEDHNYEENKNSQTNKQKENKKPQLKVLKERKTQQKKKHQRKTRRRAA